MTWGCPMIKFLYTNESLAHAIKKLCAHLFMESALLFVNKGLSRNGIKPADNCCANKGYYCIRILWKRCARVWSCVSGSFPKFCNFDFSPWCLGSHIKAWNFVLFYLRIIYVRSLRKSSLNNLRNMSGFRVVSYGGDDQIVSSKEAWSNLSSYCQSPFVNLANKHLYSIKMIFHFILFIFGEMQCIYPYIHVYVGSSEINSMEKEIPKMGGNQIKHDKNRLCILVKIWYFRKIVLPHSVESIN